MKEEKIALRGQVYATPRTESVEITNQGVLCSSGSAKGVATLNLTPMSNGSL